MLSDEQRIALLPKVMQKGKEPVTQVWLTQGDALSYSERIESAACADRDARIDELERELAEARKDAKRWLTFLSTRPQATHEVINQAIDDAAMKGQQ